MPAMNMLPGGPTLQIPLDAPTAFSATAGNAQVELTWTDPLDKYATPEGDISDTGDQLVSEWDHTVLVRKTGSQPAGPNDGTVVVSSSVRNQYQTSAYVDSGLVNDTTYYYGVFAYNKDGVASSGAFTSAMPKSGTPLSELAEGTIIKINENGSPVEFYLAKHNYEPDLNGQGRELVVRKDVTAESVDFANNGFNSWNTSAIKEWLNETYANKFSQYIKSMIGSTTFLIQTGQYTDSIFSLSLSEVNISGEKLPVSGEILPIYSILLTGVSNSYWSRDRVPYLTSHSYIITQNGTQEEIQINYSEHTRPCFTLPSDTVIDMELNVVEG